MLNNEAPPDPVMLYRSATERAIAFVEAVDPDQLGLPTPCSAWTVQQLIEHLVGGTEYLLSAATGGESAPATDGTNVDYRRGVADVLDALAEPGAMDRTCISPPASNGRSHRRWPEHSWTS